MIHYNPKEMQEYEESLKYYRDYHNTIEAKFKEGKAEGIQEEKKNTARKMKDKGYSPQIIQDLTGLTAQEIDNL